MTDKELDFSGFQAERKVDVPPPQKKAPAEKPAKKGKKKKKKSAAKKVSHPTAQAEKNTPPELATPDRATPQKPGRKKRVNVSLPVELSQRFTEKAAEEDRYLTDMVLDAYRNHYGAMRDEYLPEQRDADLPFRPRRRKGTTGRVTHMLYLAGPEVAVIDGSAAEIGLSRSELVSRLLERELS